MTHTLTAIAAAAIIALSASGTASAANAQTETSFTYNKDASADANYASFQKTAAAACKTQLSSAGYRATESTSWEMRKCTNDLVQRAVKATKNKGLIAFHNYSVNPVKQTREFASK